MNLWCVSMECAGIAEAGGVKNVTYSLCKEFSLLGHCVTLFIPSLDSKISGYVNAKLIPLLFSSAASAHLAKQSRSNFMLKLTKRNMLSLSFLS